MCLSNTASQTSVKSSLNKTEDMLKEIEKEIGQPGYFEQRWGRLTEYFFREENQDQIVGKVIDINLTKEKDRPTCRFIMDYNCAV